MEDPGQACTCWNIETDNGEPAKMGWLRLHDSVRLVTRDGTSAEGWTHGVDRRRMGGIEGATIALEMCSGGIITVEARDIATITPAVGTTDADSLLRDVAAAVRGVGAMPESEAQVFVLILDGHTTLDVSLRKRRHPCSPHPRSA